MLRAFFTLPYCIAGYFCGWKKAQEGLQNYISWCNRNSLNMNFELADMKLFIFIPQQQCFSIKSCVRGYYIYKEIWKVNVEEQIPCQCEMAAVLVTLFRQLSFTVNESYWPCFFGCVSVFSSLFINTRKTA